MVFLPTTHRVVEGGDEFLARVDHAAELVWRRDGGLCAFAIPVDHSRRELQLSNIAWFGASEAKRGDMAREPGGADRELEVL